MYLFSVSNYKQWTSSSRPFFRNDAILDKRISRDPVVPTKDVKTPSFSGKDGSRLMLSLSSASANKRAGMTNQKALKILRGHKFIFIFLLVGAWGFGPLFAACPQPALFDAILKTNVDKDGYVDYDAIRINKGGDLYQFITFLETTDLSKCTETERAAFWINAYNAHMIRLVLARPMMKSVSEDFKLFGEKFKVANHKLSLNDIEHRVLRSSTKKGGPIEGVSLKEFDPRLHFALVCGAIDCPKLSNRAYMPQTLEDALQAAAVNFVSRPKHIRIEGDTLFVSSLMRWYAEDFSNVGGVAQYLSSLLSPTLRPDAQALLDKLKTDFPDNTQFRYNWTLNSIKNKPAN
ncbi:MAG: hypothetical protein KCHDKBKB_01904 [Elusimicrobia bacterium]|nr:hypothetical protein [Elusimicrobiota bacterium]